MENYTQIVTRSTWAAALLLAFPGLHAPNLQTRAQQPAQRPAQQQSPQPTVVEVEPPEEDEASKPKEYAFNPLQAEKELNIGNFYWKKKSYRAAAMRYEEATKWNPGYAEAWLKLGEAHEKLKQSAEARAAYEQFLGLAEEDKRAGEIKKRVTKLPAPKPEPKKES